MREVEHQPLAHQDNKLIDLLDAVVHSVDHGCRADEVGQQYGADDIDEKDLEHDVGAAIDDHECEQEPSCQEIACVQQSFVVVVVDVLVQRVVLHLEFIFRYVFFVQLQKFGRPDC